MLFVRTVLRLNRFYVDDNLISEYAGKTPDFFAVKNNPAVDCGIERIIDAQTDVFPGAVFCPSLADYNLPGFYFFPAEQLYAKIFWLRIAT